MVPEIKKILYATDLTENSAYAFRYAANSAEKHDAKIYILHVIEKPLREYLSLVFPNLDHDQQVRMWEEKKKEQVSEIRKRLQELARKELADQKEPLERVAGIEVVEGEPAVEILKKAEDLNCDLVILGSHGKGKVAHAFLGSVAEKVLQRTGKPVYIIPLPKG